MKSLSQLLVVISLVTYVTISVMRIAAIWVNFRAPMSIYRALPLYPLKERVYVCTGDEWHRFPSSFFLPSPAYRLGYLKQTFDGKASSTL